MSRLPILINLYRGGLAIVLGVLLLFWPDKSKITLFNIMGFFWLSVGFAALRRNQDDEHDPGRRTTLIGGLVGIVTGLLVVTRRFTRQWVGEEVIFNLLGLVILTTGLLHMFSEYRIGGITRKKRTGIHFLLGIFEVLLGVLLLFSPSLDRPIVYWAGTVWAMLYGVLFVGTAVYDYRQRKKEEGKKELKT